MAPELFVRGKRGPPVDMFALGATFYFVLGKQYAIAALGMSSEDVAAKMKRYSITFGGNFSHVSDDSKELILWLMHPCSSWRPDAHLALACPPFTAPTTSEEISVMPSFERQLGENVDEEPFLSRGESQAGAPRLNGGNTAQQDTIHSTSWQSRVRFMSTLDPHAFEFTQLRAD
eukprot:TRINITY_DN3873_c3_g1_i1.p1 TRINITY_DN3873_c3_g1~~TRINITY_DN3873_c3_g1_i1.p1  ORF type:complete len:194 (-),score=31.75 TRINITY_DN3873_c3_g1_i1:385-906(-)